MKFVPTEINGAYLIETNPIADSRGFFARTYCATEFAKLNLAQNMVQTNISYNHQKGTLRGLHMQQKPHEEAKLVRCTAGSIFDVLVDLRKDSSTYLHWFGAELSSENHHMLYIPQGCAHGYITLIDKTEVSYQVSEYYNSGTEVGFLWNDPAFNIKWPITPVVISPKDQTHPPFQQQQLNTSST